MVSAVQTWSCLYWFRHKHCSRSCFFLLDSLIVVDRALVVLSVVDVAQIALLVVTQSLVLAGGEVATNSSDVVKSALIRTDS